MKMFLRALVGLMISAGQAIASDGQFVIDVYRTRYTTENTLKEQFKKEFNTMAECLSAKEGMNTEVFKRYTDAKLSIESKLRKTDYYAYVNVSGIIYPKKQLPYFTVDIVDKQDAERLSHFKNSPSQTFTHIDHLMRPMSDYLEIVNKSILQKHVFLTSAKCPVWHCTSGFEDPMLSKYLPVFNQIATKNKWRLVNILRNDKQPNDRASAAYLLGHIVNPKELIDILYYSIRDPDQGVRNNTMRVLGATISKSHIYDMPIDDVLLAVDFPAETDRNKALYVLNEIALRTRVNDKRIISYAGPYLVDCLKSRQPNIHDFAYNILKLVSGKKFSDEDNHSWADWIKQHSA